MGNRVRWLDAPEDHDYDAAADYLELLVSPELAAGAVRALRGADPVLKKAKDILRAACLPLLPADDPEVAAVLEKIHDGKRISPILLCRSPRGLVIADGYHRVCALYRLDDAAEVHAHLI
jgi:hypothetical protein